MHLVVLVLLMFFLFSLSSQVESSSSSSSSSYWNYLSSARSTAAAGTTTTTTTATATATATANRQQRRPRSACSFYIWDGLSAFRYHLCRRLMRDQVYEGRGGKKFVRIKPGSILDSLYPCSKHFPDRCLLCGMSFHEHLTTWWFPNLYTPYDLYLDTVKNRAAATTESTFDTIRDDEKKEKRSSWDEKKKKRTESSIIGSVVVDVADEPGLKPFRVASSQHVRRNVLLSPMSYHRPYVKLKDDESKPTTNNNNSNRHQQPKKKGDDKAAKNDATTAAINHEGRSTDSGIRYEVPKFHKGHYGTNKANLLFLVRAIILEEVDMLLWIQHRENSINEWRKMNNP